MTSVIFENQIEIPLGLESLVHFTAWTRSPEFPERGRIDYLDDRIEVEMSPEDLFTHGNLKSEVVAMIRLRVKARKMGHLFSDRTRVTSADADLSVEPDVVFVSYSSLHAGRVQLVPKAVGIPGRYVELRGGPDMVAEIVSDASEAKDTLRLPRAYHKAGIPEYWLIDARGPKLSFQIHRAEAGGYELVSTDEDGFQASAVFACRVRLTRYTAADGNWDYDLELRDDLDC